MVPRYIVHKMRGLGYKVDTFSNGSIFIHDKMNNPVDTEWDLAQVIEQEDFYSLDVVRAPNASGVSVKSIAAPTSA